MTWLEVVRCGPGTTLQDAGRIGWRRFGVARAGAMDLTALAIANRLVGNPDDAAAVELTLAGGVFRLEGGPRLAAVAGGGAELRVAGEPVPPGESVRLQAGTILEVSAARTGVYACLAIGGGFDLPAEMGSRASHVRSGIGPDPLKPGDPLPLGLSNALVPQRIDLPRTPSGPLRIMAGPQADWFEPSEMARLLETSWTLDPRSDRMGRFIAGTSIASRPGSMVSDGVLPGCIQVPPSGQPIILMRDCQTTGGYPKIATVISADLDRLAQLPPGAEVRFALVARETAVAAAAEAARNLARLVPRPIAGPPDTAALLAKNLVSGVVDARDGEAA